MKLRRDGWYHADKGRHFVLTQKGKDECVSYKNKTVGKPVDEYDYEAVGWAVDKGYVVEENIPGWKKLKGYEVVYYYNGYRLSAGNPQTFPTRKLAEKYKNHYDSYPWHHDELLIEEVEYEGVPLSESKTYNGKEVIDKEHCFGLDCCEIGDYFTSEMVDEFMNALPPACMRSDCMQMGEPTADRIDEKTGKGKPTYQTFKRITDDIYEYCGDCFRGENIKHGKELQYI